MRHKLILVSIIAAVAASLGACGGGTTGPNSNAVNATATNNVNATVGGGVTNQPGSGVETNKRVEAPKTNDAPTVATIMSPAR